MTAPPASVPHAISLFSNCGAGDVGFAHAGFQFRIMAERVESRLAVALCNHPAAHGVLGDLRETWSEVVQVWRKNHRSATPDLVAACPPCQGMSTARSDRGPENDPDASSRDPRNLLVIPIANITRELLPTILVVENVAAFLRRKVRNPETGQSMSAAHLLLTLLQDNYDSYPFLTDLADFGVPQTRKRAFLTFVRRSSRAASVLRQDRMAPYPIPTTASDHHGKPVTLGEALESFRLPSLDSQSATLATNADRPLHFVPVWPPRQYRMVAAIPPGSGASAWENRACDICGPVDAQEDAVLCDRCGAPLLRPVVVADGHARFIHGFRRVSYRRMHPNRPAATLTTASGRIGSSRTIHPTENRVFSPLECALLQTIPHDFIWGDVLARRGTTELRAMIGEAVPPRFTQLHGDLLLRVLAGDRADIAGIPLTDPRCWLARRRLTAQ